jgi:hypothetical protein
MRDKIKRKKKCDSKQSPHDKISHCALMETTNNNLCEFLHSPCLRFLFRLFGWITLSALITKK